MHLADPNNFTYVRNCQDVTGGRLSQKWKCDRVTVWLCDSVTLWLCDCVTVLLYVCVTIWPYYCVTEQLCDCVMIWLCNCVTVWLTYMWCVVGWECTRSCNLEGDCHHNKACYTVSRWGNKEKDRTTGQGWPYQEPCGTVWHHGGQKGIP